MTMNRPRVKDYWLDNETFDVLNYERDFKNYCDELEKAFERACYELAYSNKQLRDLDKGFVKMTEVDWKEYILKNV